MLVIGNGSLITRNPNNPFIDSGAVAIEDGIIIFVGDTLDAKSRYPDAEWLDARGGVIMPGFINAHNHIYSALARGLSIDGFDPKGFLDILSGLWWTIDRNLTLDATRASASCTFIDCIEQGVTTVIDHHASYGGIEGSLFTIAEEAAKYGLRVNLCYEVSDRGGVNDMRSAVKENVEFINWAKKQTGDFVHAMMGMHAPFTLSDATLDYVMSMKPDGVGCHIHVAEGIDDVLLSLSRHGKRPVFRLHDFGVLGENTILGHCTHVSQAEIDLIAQTNTMVSHNPESNMKNAIGCPPVLKMLSSGVTVGLGTDGYTNDMLESLKVANIFHKHALCDPNAGSAEIPAMLFNNNAQICRRFMTGQVGVLAPGAYGDVIVVDYTPNTPMNAGNFDSHILFGMSGRSVVSTVVGGVVRMKNRELIGVEKAQELAKCREQAIALAKRINV